MLSIVRRSDSGRILRAFYPTNNIKAGYQTRASSSVKIQPAKRLAGTSKNIWITFTELARTTGAVNIGQGFSDYSPPQHVCDALRESIKPENFMMHQVARSFGHPRLVNAIANLYGLFHDRKLNPLTEILVTAGAYGSLYSTFQGLVDPGDEVIIIEPFFDCYHPMTVMAGGIPRFIPLRSTRTGDATSADWKLDPKELESKFSSRTKLIIVNTPNNPLGKVYTREELDIIASLCNKYDVVCIADEVYEWMIYPGAEHIRIASLPGMWDRTITISSGGKALSATGWRLGWSIGPEHLIKPLTMVHQNSSYATCTPIQEAAARVLELELSRVGDKDTCYLHTLANKELLPKRNQMAKMLKNANLQPAIPEGGYFMLTDWSQLGVTEEMIEDGSGDTKDFKFAKWLTKEWKLATIPLSGFYSPAHRHMAEDFVRICYFKKEETIEAVGNILQSFKN